MKDLVNSSTAAQGIPLTDAQAAAVAATLQSVLTKLAEAADQVEWSRLEPPVTYVVNPRGGDDR